MKYDNILETIGSTPVVRIEKLAPEGANLFVKVEAFNPMGSIKDRLALGVIEHAEKRGALKPGQTVVEATSGNTGIGLAMVCARKGYPLVIVMAENFSVERRKMMRFLGARVVLTPASDRGTGMLRKAEELAKTHGWFLCRQFENEANANIHSETTAQEILRDFEGESLDYWVTGFGTGGTLKGVARVLREERPETRIVVCEPENSQILASGIPQPKNEEGAPSASHPRFRTHMMQGWSPDFVPKLAEDVQGQELVDEFVPVDGSEALHFSRELARQEGIFTGITGGATFASARKVCEAHPGATVLCMLPDTGERYLSTPLFEDVETEMSGEEIEISQSTPSYRFDKGSAGAPPQLAAGSDPVDPKAAEFVEDAIENSRQAVVMFALEYCEFCWAVRKLFEAYGIDYRAVEMDTAEMQADDTGAKIQNALCARTGWNTVPQVFVSGEFVGGCAETLDAWSDGTFRELLRSNGIAWDESVRRDAASFLPDWLHAR